MRLNWRAFCACERVHNRIAIHLLHFAYSYSDFLPTIFMTKLLALTIAVFAVLAMVRGQPGAFAPLPTKPMPGVLVP